MQERPLYFGRKQQPQHYRNSFSNYAQYQLIVVTEGALQAEYENEHKQFVRSSLGPLNGIILCPGSDFRLSTPHAPYGGHCILYDQALSDEGPAVLRFQADLNVRLVVESIEQEYLSNKTPAALLPLYELLFYRCKQVVQQKQMQSDEQSPQHICQQIDALLQTSAHSSARLEDLLQALPYSERHLRRLYRQQRGHSIKQAHMKIKLQEACYLLSHSQLNVTAIAYELGYPSSQYFSGLFKQRFAETPAAYRRRMNCTQK